MLAPAPPPAISGFAALDRTKLRMPGAGGHGRLEAMTLDPHTALALALSVAVGYTMVVAGVAKKQLHWRRRRPRR
jgi:hypothetical protein